MFLHRRRHVENMELETPSGTQTENKDSGGDAARKVFHVNQEPSEAYGCKKRNSEILVVGEGNTPTICVCDTCYYYESSNGEKVTKQVDKRDNISNSDANVMSGDAPNLRKLNLSKDRSCINCSEISGATNEKKSVDNSNDTDSVSLFTCAQAGGENSNNANDNVSNYNVVCTDKKRYNQWCSKVVKLFHSVSDVVDTQTNKLLKSRAGEDDLLSTDSIWSRTCIRDTNTVVWTSSASDHGRAELSRSTNRRSLETTIESECINDAHVSGVSSKVPKIANEADFPIADVYSTVVKTPKQCNTQHSQSGPRSFYSENLLLRPIILKRRLTFAALITSPRPQRLSATELSDNQSPTSPRKRAFWKSSNARVIPLRRVGGNVEVRRSHAAVEHEIPDGGYGWVCVICVFIMYFMVMGVSRSSGVIYSEIKNEYSNMTHGTISLILSLSLSLTVACAMVAGGLARKYTSRYVGIVCGLGISFSLVAIYFTMRIEYLFVCYFLAGIFGAGASMPGLLVLALYFRRYRSLAIGFALTGTAVAGLVQPPLLEYLCSLYTFRGAMLIMGALTLHTIPCAMLLRNPWDPVVLAYKKRKQMSSQFEEGDDLTYVIPVEHKYESEVSDIAEGPVSEATLRSIPASSSNSGTPYTPGSYQEKKPPQTRRHKVFELVLHSLTMTHYHRRHDSWVSHTRTTSTYGSHPIKAEARYSLYEPKRGRFSQWLYNTLYIDVGFLLNPVFLVVFLTSFFSTGSYPHVVIFLPSHGEAAGYETGHAAWLVTASSFGDVLGRAFFGWFFDKNVVSLQYGLLVCLFIVAVSLWLLVLATNYACMAVCVFFYGLAGGPTVLLIPILLSDHHGAAALGSSYGIVRLGQAVSCAIFPPLAGSLRDYTGNYTFSFLLLSLSAALGVFIMFFMTLAKKRYRKIAQRRAFPRLDGQRPGDYLLSNPTLSQMSQSKGSPQFISPPVLSSTHPTQKQSSGSRRGPSSTLVVDMNQ